MCFSLIPLLLLINQITAIPLLSLVIAIRFVPPTANFIYPLEESRIFYDTSEGVVATKLDAFGGKSCLRALSEKSHRCVVETERFYMKKSAIRISAAFFSRKTNLQTNAWLVLFTNRGEKEKSRKELFPDQEALLHPRVFQRKIAKSSKGR